MTREVPARRPGPGRIVGRQELAELFGVVPSSIVKYQNLGMPVFKIGTPPTPYQFDSAACLWWRVNYLVNFRLGNHSLDLALRKGTAEAGIKEMEVERAISQVAPLSIILRSLEAVFDVVRRQLDKIAPEAAPLVARQPDMTRCHLIIAEAINKARIRIQADARKLPELEKP